MLSQDTTRIGSYDVPVNRGQGSGTLHPPMNTAAAELRLSKRLGQRPVTRGC